MYWAVAAALSLPSTKRSPFLQELVAPLPAPLRMSLKAVSAFAFGPVRLAAKVAAFILLRPFDVLPALQRAAARCLW